MRKPDDYKVLEDGRQLFTWILGDNSKVIEIKHPKNELGTKYERFHNSNEISSTELERLINGE